MCRLLGVVSRSIEAHPTALAEAPKSLAELSAAHPHGWGIAVHDGRQWSLERRPTCALADARFYEIARRARGRMLVAHVRKATVGRTVLANTHPFRRDGWVFAHNGTISDLDWLARRTSSARLREVEGDTDSERFFAFLMTALDNAGATKGSRASPEAASLALAKAVRSATERPKLGAANFLLSDGQVMFAHRFGRSLFISKDAGVARVASEAGHEGVWQEVPDRTLFRIEGGREPVIERVAGSSARREGALPLQPHEGSPPSTRQGAIAP
jgi:predicted glutamine amidotransferase